MTETADDIRARYRAIKEKFWQKPKRQYVPKPQHVPMTELKPQPKPYSQWEKLPEAPLAHVLSTVAIKHGLPILALKGVDRSKRCAMARQEYFYRAAIETKASTTLIGQLVNRDHSTVLHGMEVHAARFRLLHPWKIRPPQFRR